MPVRDIAVGQMQRDDLDALLDADGGEWWQRSRDVWQRRLDAQDRGMMHLALARSDGKISGYGYLNFESLYPFFRNQRIPEIGDLRVAERFRGQGVATKIMRYLENCARAAGACEIGLAVGLYADYGAAQRLYVRLGYLPDGHGVTSHHKAVAGGETVRVDDDLVLWLIKPQTAVKD
ncbi:MAG TPA: GNAT family N-acetyltransferase [Rhizomicrobium sp.]|jgi:GNAT superfamily N-acetyltransferase|nr:GNAT family N-acetyltransferase [Rhizomicrobium sp.]